MGTGQNLPSASVSLDTSSSQYNICGQPEKKAKHDVVDWQIGVGAHNNSVKMFPFEVSTLMIMGKEVSTYIKIQC